MTDDELFTLIGAELFVALVGDVLDLMGLQKQFLHPSLRTIEPAMVSLGRAMTVVEQDRAADDQGPQFGRMIEALDDLKPGEVYICAGASHRYALWGGLTSTRALQCGAAGAVVHGCHRDTNEILRLGFPVASFGGYAQDQGPRGIVADWRVPIHMDGVEVRSGDIVFADRDGVLIVPEAASEEAFARAFEKARGEKTVLLALQSGMSTVEAFATYGIM